jgi:hypothetical protein
MFSCAQRSGQQCLVEEQADLVPGRDRRQDDSSRCATFHGKAGWSYRRRGEGQPRDLRFTATGGGRCHRTGCGGRTIRVRPNGGLSSGQLQGETKRVPLAPAALVTGNAAVSWNQVVPGLSPISDITPFSGSVRVGGQRSDGYEPVGASGPSLPSFEILEFGLGPPRAVQY